MANLPLSLPVFRLERFFAKYEFTTKYNACASDCEAIKMKDLLALADDECKQLWENLSMEYTESHGLPQLREQVASGLYPSLSADQVEILCPQEGIYLGLLAVLSAEDHVISMSPSYQSLTDNAVAMGCDVSLWEPKERTESPAKELVFDVQDMKKLLKPNTKLLIVNFPHNPTGFIPTQAEWDDIVSFCKEHDLYLFSDEMYRLLEHDESDRLPSACEVYDKAITLSGMSKSFGMPGVRIGWLVTRDKDILSRVSVLKDYTTICPPGPSEILSLIGLRNKDKLVARSKETIRKGVVAVNAFMDKHKDVFACAIPKAGPITFVKVIADGLTAEALSERLVHDCGILILPGTMYTDAMKNRFRLGFGRDNVAEILDVWETNFDSVIAGSKKARD